MSIRRPPAGSLWLISAQHRTPSRDARDVRPIQITATLSPARSEIGRFTVAVISRRRIESRESANGEATFFPATAWAEQAERAAQSLARG